MRDAGRSRIPDVALLLTERRFLTRIPFHVWHERGFVDCLILERRNVSLVARSYSAALSGATTLSGTPWVLGEALAAAIASAVLVGMPPLRVRPALTGPSSSWPE